MLQEIVKLTNTWWVIYMALAILISVGLPISIFFIVKTRFDLEQKRWTLLSGAVDGLMDCRIENLKPMGAIFKKNAPELFKVFQVIENDSKSIFRNLWIPSPGSRFLYPESFAKPIQSLIRPTAATLTILTGIFLSAVALILALYDASSLEINATVRLIAMIPLIISAFAFLVILDQRNRLDAGLKRLHRQLMLVIERKVPVYTQAGETAVILNRFSDHDQVMTNSVSQLATRVEKLASGELTEAVANAIKFVLSASIGPSLQKSTDSLSMLAVQLEKQMRNSLNTLGDRLAALEFEQTESSKFLKNQYETVTSTLLQQQEMSFQQLRAVQSLLLEQIRDQQQQTLSLLTETQQRTLTALTEGQQLSYKSLGAEQQESLQKMLNGYQGAVSSLLTLSETSQHQQNEQYKTAWTEVKNGLTETLSGLKEAQMQLVTELQTSQTSLATSLQTAQKSLYTSVQSKQDVLSESLQTRHETLTASLQTQQETLATSLSSRQEELVNALQTQLLLITTSLLTQQEQLSSVLTTSQSELTSATKALTEQVTGNLMTQQESVASSLLTQQERLSTAIQMRQDELSNTLTVRQDELTKVLQTQQVVLAASLQTRQNELLEAFQTRQADLVMSLKSSQESLYAATNNLQEKLSTTFHSQQLASIAQMQTAQDETLQKVADYQHVSLTTLTDDVAKNLGTYLDKYLEPVSARLIASADVLVAAQSYADKVQDAFEIQREQVAIVEAGMKDAINSFVETRTIMMSDLSDLRESASVMSGSANKMSAVFAGSESGLSDSIKLLSGNMSILGENLEQITSSSVNTTKQQQEQMEQTHTLNQRQIVDLTGQITTFSDELATRIDQLTLGFTGITEDLIKNVRKAISEQNDTLGGNVRHLVEIMSEESRSMSLFAQQINMSIESLSTTLNTSVAGFNTDIHTELGNVLTQFDQNIADVLNRLSIASNELGDAVEALPAALAPYKKI